MLRAIFPGRENDLRLQHVMEQLPAAAFLAAPMTGSISAVNGKAAALTEWARGELLSLSLSELVSAPSAADALAAIHALGPGQARTLHGVKLQTRSGRLALVDLRLSAYLANPESQRLVLITATPVSERLAAESLAERETRTLDCLARMAGILEAPGDDAFDAAVALIAELLNADAACYYSVAADFPGWKLAAVSAEAAAFPPALGPSESDYMHTIHRWAASQRSEGFLHQAARAAGWTALMTHPVHPLGATNAAVGTLCVAYRQSQALPAQAQQLLGLGAAHIHLIATRLGQLSRQAASKALAVRLADQIAAISAQVHEGIVVINAHGTLDEINSLAARMLGYRSEDVTGRDFEDILVGDNNMAERVQTALNPDTPADSLETRLLRRNGEPFPATVRIQPMRTGGCVVTLQDQSEAQANAIQQEHIDQLAFVGQTTNAFAHEVRAPLHIMSMGVQRLAECLPPDPEVSRILEAVQAECARLSDLMQGMLAWTKPIVPNLQPTSLDKVFRRLVARFSLKVDRHNVRLNYVADPNCPLVLADAPLLERVFVNLMDNAIQAMPAGGHLSIQLRRVQSGGDTLVEARVGDEGPGIPEEARRRIFDPYFSTKPSGTGLGLAISKRLVTIHHGAIGVESFPGVGTVFTVTLPALAETHDSGEQA